MPLFIKTQSVSLLLIVLLLSSCDFINPEETIPSYIKIDTFLLQAGSSSQGPYNHSITDAWINVDGDFIGVFELPALAPVLHSGFSELIIKPGIKNNGIAASRISYPFYTNYSIDTVLDEKGIVLINPVVAYKEETVFDWIENFEDVGISIDTSITSNVGIGDSIVNGSHVAKVVLLDSSDVFRAQTVNYYNFPAAGSPLYLEMDYKTNNSLVVGLYINNSNQYLEQPVISINPSEQWKKIYIDFTYFSSMNNSATLYYLFFKANKTDSIDRSVILFDNLKLLHF